MENLELNNEMVNEGANKSGVLILGGIAVAGITGLAILATKIIKKIKNKKKIAIQEPKDEEIFDVVDEQI